MKITLKCLKMLENHAKMCENPAKSAENARKIAKICENHANPIENARNIGKMLHLSRGRREKPERKVRVPEDGHRPQLREFFAI